MNEFLENLKREASENPIFAMAVAAGLLTAASRFINASGNARNSKAWAKEVDRRVKASRK